MTSPTVTEHSRREWISLIHQIRPWMWIVRCQVVKCQEHSPWWRMLHDTHHPGQRLASVGRFKPRGKLKSIWLVSQGNGGLVARIRILIGTRSFGGEAENGIIMIFMIDNNCIDRGRLGFSSVQEDSPCLIPVADHTWVRPPPPSPSTGTAVAALFAFSTDQS